VQRAGSPSWRITVDNGKALNAACYVRDAAGLPIDDDPSVPPRLLHVTVGEASPLAVDAAPAWRQWWQGLTSEPHIDPRAESHPSAGVRPSSPDFARLFDELLGAATTWSSDLARRHPAPNLAPFAPQADRQRRYELHRAVAEEVINDYAVTPDRVEARIELLWCGDPWAHQPSPGVLFCSLGTWSDDEEYRRVLRSTFESGLARRS
jgi:hypothetical protein